MKSTQKRSRTEKWDIQITILVIVAIILLISQGVTAYANAQSTSKMRIATSADIALQANAFYLNNIKSTVVNHMNLLQTLAQSPVLIDATGTEHAEHGRQIAASGTAWQAGAEMESAPTVNDVLLAFHETHAGNGQAGVFLTDASGEIIASSESEATIDDNIQNAVLTAGTDRAGEIRYKSSSGKWILEIATPVRDRNGETLGVLLGDVDLTSALESSGSQSQMVLVDGQGVILYAPETAWVGKTIDEDTNALLSSGEPGWSEELADPDGNQALTTYTALDGPDDLTPAKAVISYADLATLKALRLNDVGANAAAAGITLLCLGLVSVLVSRRITSPLSVATATVQRLAVGSVDLTEEERKGVMRFLGNRGELGALTRGYAKLIDYLNTMAKASVRIAEGDLSFDVYPRGESDLLGNAFKKMIGYLSRTAAVAEKLAEGDINIEHKALSRKDVLGNAFARMIRNQVEMVDAARRLASGDLAFEVKPKSEADVQGSAYAQMIVTLRGMVARVKENADLMDNASHQFISAAETSAQASAQIASAVEEVAGSINRETENVTLTVNSIDLLGKAIEGVAKGANEQSHSIITVSMLVGELTEALQEISRGAVEQTTQMQQAISAREAVSQAINDVVVLTQSVTEESDRSAQAAQEGASLAQETSQGMERVRRATQMLADKVNDLGQRSAQIGTIVDSIDEIASQTNLLALNAAIEAARAGEHGRGFAVVADEVRKLAERSVNSTKEISGIISSVQTGVQDAIETMLLAGEDVRMAVELTEQEGAVFRTIADGTMASATRVGSIQDALESIRSTEELLQQAIQDAMKISERNQESTQTMESLNSQVMSSLDAVSAVVEENSASTEEMAASAYEVRTAMETIEEISKGNTASMDRVSQLAKGVIEGAEQVNRDAHHLAEMAETLQSVVLQFKLGEDAEA